MASNRSIEYHQQWIGYLNPTGLVFSPNALDDAQAVINEGVVSEQNEFSALVVKTINDNTEFAGFENVRDLFFKVLNWRESDLNSDQTVITQYSFSHPQFGEVVSPTYVAKVNDEKVILIQQIDQDDFDKTANTEDTWNSSPHFKFERLLREKQISTGLIVSKEKLRLIFAPRGESSGYIDFPFKIMYQPSGRLVFAAFRELLSDAKVFNSPKGQSLIEILELSRKYQAQVSIDLSGQVLAALYELLRGFQTANDDESGKLLEKTLKENPQLIYEGLLTTLLRMVFIMYAEDRNLLATDEVYQSSYSLAGLYERLRQDEAQNPDTMDSRYGAWAHLISLFRLIYDGAEYDSEKGKVVLPARHGHLFDPNIYPFLEGRDSKDQLYNKAPKISDGVVFRVLKNLLVLKGERISYRTLDVEQIGSVYETMMGFELGRAEGETIALKPSKSHGAPLPINLDEILSSKDKSKKLGEVSELKLSDKVKKEFNECKTIDELESVLDKRIDRRATPFRLSKDAMVLVPSEARRKSGSHYTPRELTEPIVRVALEPIFKNLGDNPTPEQILDLKICDPAMGSGAFLVEACRQLSEKLVESWTVHKVKIIISADEDELLHARRLIAQKCLYGVDKNHMAVNLAKLSLWLVTLAKDHSFSFLDHNLKHGDSLIGLNNKQIMSFDYIDREKGLPLFEYMKDKVQESLEARDEIINATEEKNYDALKIVEEYYEERLEPLRLVGDLVLKCFFDGKKEKERSAKIQEHITTISNFFAANSLEKLKEYCLKSINDENFNLTTFHWELEFPEVFSRGSKSGFDCIIGNPPFANKDTIAKIYKINFWDWIKLQYENSNGNSDLVAFFFRRAALLISKNGAFGFIATNTIYQGDTRNSGIGYLVNDFGFKIYNATKSLKWPGDAAVEVSVVFLCHTQTPTTVQLNKTQVEFITPFLLDKGTTIDPFALKQNEESCFLGHTIHGQGFLFDDEKANKGANPKSTLDEITESCIEEYITVGDILDEPEPAPHSSVINFKNYNLEYISQHFPESLKIVLEKVKPYRQEIPETNSWNKQAKKEWWKFGAYRHGLSESAQKYSQMILTPQLSKYRLFHVSPSSWCVDKQLIAIIRGPNCEYDFAILQSSIHETWCLFFGSTLEDRPLYSISSCYETFPFPTIQEVAQVSQVGNQLIALRQSIMSRRKVGMTKLYNLYHDEEIKDVDILELRQLHTSLNRVVADSYGWHDLKLEYQFSSEDADIEDADNTKNKKSGTRLLLKENLRDEILARLLKLNQDKHDEEVRIGLHKR